MSDPAAPHVAILGAGPVGLDAALAAAERTWPFTVYEAGRVGESIRGWGHVRLFSPWSMNVSRRMERALEQEGVELPEGEVCPTGHELVERLLEPVADLPALAARVRTDTRVVGVARKGLLKHEEISSPERASRSFRILLRGPDGEESVEEADLVLDCTGQREVPNPLGADGIPAPGEAASEAFIEREIPDVAGSPDRWAGRRVLVVGGGYSAQTAARDLALLAERPGTAAPEVLWSVRRREPDWGIVQDDPLPERSALARRAAELAGGASEAVTLLPGTQVRALDPGDVRVRVVLGHGAQPGTGGGSGDRAVEVDRVLALTGSVGDRSIYRALQVHECYASSGPMKLSAALLAQDGGGVDCLTQSSLGAETLENPEPDFYILGSKSYGRNPTFLLRVGWEQVDDLFDALDPDAARVA